MIEEKIKSTLAAVKPELLDIARQMYEHPELGFQEVLASRLHTEFLERHGFTVTRRLCGFDTGYRGDFDAGKPGPHVAFLAEFDALPELGHGCGHNLVGTCALGAGVALASVLGELGGRVTVYGAPAEETSGGKVDFVADGQFNGVDLAILCHPGNHWSRSGASLALEPVQFEFYGKSAHAASAPEQGVNALDAALVTMTSVNALREHIRSDARIHGIVADGGRAANVVPDYAKVQYYVRATKKGYLTQLVERVKNCGRAGALATGCEVKITRFETAYDNMLTNETLSDLFGSVLKEHYGIEQEPPRETFGSTDLGNVSLVCPAIQPIFDITGDRSIAAHTREMAACTQTPYAAASMEKAACAMAITAARVLADQALLNAVWEEFKSAEK